jgi:hypothetical protein
MKPTRYPGIAVLATLLVAGAAGVFPQSAEAATVCKPRMTGQGTGMGLAGQGSALARSNALADWSSKVRAAYGAAFAETQKARSVKYDCRQGAILEAKCVVTAVPCGEVAKAKKSAKGKAKRRR